MSFLRWLIAQTLNVLGILGCAILAVIATVLDDLYDIWEDAKDDWRKVLACTIIAALLFAIGFNEVLQGLPTLGYFLMLLAAVPGLPAARHLFNSWREGAQRSMEWHKIDKGW